MYKSCVVGVISGIASIGLAEQSGVSETDVAYWIIAVSSCIAMTVVYHLRD